MVDFKLHREKLVDKLKPLSIAIIPAAFEKSRNSDVDYAFRQDSNFYYLTGFNEPDAVAVIIKQLDGTAQTILFNQSKDQTQELWTGKRAGQEGAVAEYGADLAFPIEKINEELPKLLLGKTRIYYAWEDKEHKLPKQLQTWLKSARQQNKDDQTLPNKSINLTPVINELRLVKDETEIACLREAAKISAAAHRQIMLACQPGMQEFELQGIHDGHVIRSGCNALAYPSIVAAGANACTLHYTQNNATIRDGDLVLIDAAGEYKQYAADITRTIPANGTFTAEQKAIYNIVLNAQKAGIAAVKPGITFKELDIIIMKALIAGLIELGLLSGEVDKIIEDQGYKSFYPHGFGHWLGQDVHDVGAYRINGTSRILQANMAFTIEPGIYVQPDNLAVDEKWRGIGIRIEDDILITDDGCEVLSKDVPKEIDDIEALMARSHSPCIARQFEHAQSSRAERRADSNTPANKSKESTSMRL